MLSDYPVDVPGQLGVVCGPMKSGKTDELIRLTRKLNFNNLSFGVFKPIIDNRKGTKLIESRNKDNLDCVPISEPEELLSKAGEKDVVLIDEAQFFDKDIVKIILKLCQQGKHVIAFGLDLDFRGEPFGPMPEILSYADYVHKITAYCDVCAGIGTRTQRIIDGKPAQYNSPLILVGGDDLYEVRCKEHHEVPGKPTLSVKVNKNLKLIK